MLKAYDPANVEPRWYAFWLEHDVFLASSDAHDERPTYCVPMPPPNVTGALHMGHALMTTHRGRAHPLAPHARLRRRCGLPGSTTPASRRRPSSSGSSRREGLTRHDLGRAAFVERVWKWKGESGGRIALQQRELGASADWSELKFTMDPDMAKAVTEAFVRLYEEGLIYRDTRLINWCTDCRTALSDLEVENEEGAKGELFEFAYRVEGSDEEIVVATTRPETMLGDTAVAVHPDDPRYAHLHGRRARAPLRRPNHPDHHRRDPRRSEVRHRRGQGDARPRLQRLRDRQATQAGRDHHLRARRHDERERGRVPRAGPQGRAQSGQAAPRRARPRARDQAACLDAAALRALRHHRRADDLDAMVRADEAARRARARRRAPTAARGSSPKNGPRRTTTSSRTSRTGASRASSGGATRSPRGSAPSGHVTVARDDAHAPAPPAARRELQQDDDVLDTWFSSGLWPFSTLGWPNKTPLSTRFYPASDMETGLRHPVLLGRPHDDDGAPLHGRGALPARLAARHSSSTRTATR